MIQSDLGISNTRWCPENIHLVKQKNSNMMSRWRKLKLRPFFHDEMSYPEYISDNRSWTVIPIKSSTSSFLTHWLQKKKNSFAQSWPTLQTLDHKIPFLYQWQLNIWRREEKNSSPIPWKLKNLNPWPNWRTREEKILSVLFFFCYLLATDVGPLFSQVASNIDKRLHFCWWRH